jgi:anti-sigma-K factor RskA
MRRRAAGLHTLVGAYVMDAVPPADQQAFERHLGGCAACQDEVRTMREATARLAAAAAAEPRPELRGQTLQAAATLRQEPPLLAAPPRRLFRWLPRRAAGAYPARGVFRSGWLAVTAAVAVLAAVAAIGLGLHLGSMQDRLSVADQRDHAIAEVVGASDAVTMTAPVSTGGTATVVMSQHKRSLVFIAARLSALPASRGYELWLMGPSGDRSAGMLPQPRSGMSGPMVVDDLHAGDQVGLTVEPAGGSPRPSSPPIVLVALGH